MVFKNPSNSFSLNSKKIICKLFIGSINKRGLRVKSLNNFFFTLLLLNKVYEIYDPISFVINIVDKVRPKVNFVSKKVAGIVYKLPRFISLDKSRSISIRWIVLSAISRNSYEKFPQKLAKELFDISRGSHTQAIKKRLEYHTLARSNRPFLRYLKKKK